MYNNRIPIFLVSIVVTLACNLLAPSNSSSTPSAGSAVPGAAPATELAPQSVTNVPAQGISAESPSPHSIRIQWEPMNGSEKYLLELQVGDEFIPIASLPAAQTSYQDDNVPPATRFTYRLSSLINDEKRASKEITVETLPITAAPIQVGIEFDSTPNLIETDITTLDLSKIDPDNFDPADFLPQPIVAEAVIGPQGGELTVTGSNGVVYTLLVPAGALRVDVPMKLRPISALSNFPLSGGLLAGVFIEPAALVFDIPAQLTMLPPVDFAFPSAKLLVGFAFDDDGQDFHLIPLDPGGGQSRLSRSVASLNLVPNGLPPLSEIGDALYGGGYGQASATPQEVRQLAKQTPAKAQNRTAQQLALNQLDELTPLTPIDDGLTPLLSNADLAAAKLANSILQKAGQADDWGKFMEVMDDFRTLLNASKDQYSKDISARIFEQLAAKAQALLKKNQGDCLTYDDYMAQDLVERLSNPKEQFSKMLSEVFKAKYGQKLLDDLTNMVKGCKYQLSMNSNMTFETEGDVLKLKANFENLQLFPVFSKGEIFLWGGGMMQLSDAVSGACSYPINHYPELTFLVEKMIPVFENGLLVDFALKRYGVRGWSTKYSVSSKERRDGCPAFVNLSGGGDYWTGLFTIARIDDPIMDWQISDGLKNGSSLTAVWKSARPTFVPMGVSGSRATETTTFNLKVTKNKK